MERDNLYDGQNQAFDSGDEAAIAAASAGIDRAEQALEAARNEENSKMEALDKLVNA